MRTLANIAILKTMGLKNWCKIGKGLSDFNPRNKFVLLL